MFPEILTSVLANFCGMIGGKHGKLSVNKERQKKTFAVPQSAGLMMVVLGMLELEQNVTLVLFEGMSRKSISTTDLNRSITIDLTG